MGTKRKTDRMTPAKAIVGARVKYTQTTILRMAEEDWEPIREALWDAGFKVVKRKMPRRKR